MRCAGIFETHAHYDDAAFDDDRDELVSSLPENGIETVIDVMSDMASLEKVSDLMERYPFVYGAAGIHPEEIKDINMADMEKVRALARMKKCLAIGEIGLDYYWDKDNSFQQRYWFEYQMEMAREEGLPVIIHSRDAAEDTVESAKEAKLSEIGGVMHCFSYSKEIAKIFLDMGVYLGIGGVITFKNARKLVETVEYAPIESLLLETDCPYMAPVPNRGKRNSSLYLPFVAEKIAEIKGISSDEVISITSENAKRLFKKYEQIV